MSGSSETKKFIANLITTLKGFDFLHIDDTVSSWSNTVSNNKFPTEKLVKDSLDSKLDKTHTSYKGKNVVTNSSTGAIEFEDKPTIPSASTTTPSADTTSGSYGSGTVYARSNHTHPKSSLYAESSHSHGNLSNEGKITTSHNGTYSTFVGVQDSTGILYKASKINSDIIIDGTAHANIGSNANDNQSAINTAINTALGNKANASSLSTVATTGDYEDLLNLPEEICITDFYYDATSDELVLNTCTDNDISTITSKEDKSNKVTSWSATPTHSHYPSEKLVKDYIDDLIGDIIEYIEG